MATLIRTAALANYLEVAQHVGLNPQPVLRRFGLSTKLLANPEQLIPVQAGVSLLEASAAESHCINFGLRMAELRPDAAVWTLDRDFLVYRKQGRQSLSLVAPW